MRVNAPRRGLNTLSIERLRSGTCSYKGGMACANNCGAQFTMKELENIQDSYANCPSFTDQRVWIAQNILRHYSPASCNSTSTTTCSSGEDSEDLQNESCRTVHSTNRYVKLTETASHVTFTLKKPTNHNEEMEINSAFAELFNNKDILAYGLIERQPEVENNEEATAELSVEDTDEPPVDEQHEKMVLRRVTFLNRPVCVRFFCQVLGISNNKLYRMVGTPGAPGIPTAENDERIKISAAKRSVVNFLERQLLVGEKMPDREEVHLPYGTKRLVWEDYMKHCDIHPGLYLPVSCGYFRKIWWQNKNLRKYLKCRKFMR